MGNTPKKNGKDSIPLQPIDKGIILTDIGIEFSLINTAK
jgi:hypothetical protein